MNPQSFTIRAMEVADIDSIVSMQDECYEPPYREKAETFLKKLSFFPLGCLAVDDSTRLCAYVFSHPWNAAESVELDSNLAKIPQQPDCLYIHDLAVRESHRGHKIASQLIAEMTRLASDLRLNTLSLVAVQGAETFWLRHGFTKVRRFPYGANALGTHMIRPLPAGLSQDRRG